MLIYDEISNSDVLSLHLVLPPPSTHNLDPSHHPPPRQSHTSHPFVPQRPASTGQLPGGDGARPPTGAANFGRGGPGLLPNNMLPPWQIAPMMPGQLPAGIHEAMNNFAALGHGAHFGTGPAVPTGGLPSNQIHPGIHQQMHFPPIPVQFQQLLAQQQQARAAARQNGVANAPSEQNPLRTASAPPPESERTNTPGQTNSPAQGQNGTNTVVREGQGPHGIHYSLVINQTTGSLPLPNMLALRQAHHNGQAPISAPAGTHLSGSTLTPNPAFNMQQAVQNIPTNVPWGGQSNVLPPPYPAGRSDPPQERDARPGSNLDTSAHAVQLILSNMEANLSRGEVPSETEINSLEASYNVMRSAASEGGPQLLLRARYWNTMNAAAQARLRGLVDLNSTPILPPIGASIPQNPMITPQPSVPSTVYLLSSPTGPQALLLSPTGIYSSLGLNIGRHPLLPIVPHPQFSSNQGQARNNANLREGQPAVGAQPEAQPRPGRVIRLAQHAREPERNDEVRDLMRILLPLGGHLWRLVRLFGFVYFLTAGAGWRRAIMLCICAAIVFIAQTGALRPLQQAVWDPLRRHIEGLVPLGANDRAVEPNANRDGAEGQARPNAQLDPRDVADRLIRERQAQNGSVFQRNLQRAERAVALFIASLVPGVGERHVAATEAAEAARQAQEREREERARREAEERTQRDEVEVGTAGSGDEHFTDTEETQRERERSNYQPLVEI